MSLSAVQIYDFHIFLTVKSTLFGPKWRRINDILYRWGLSLSDFVLATNSIQNYHCMTKTRRYIVYFSTKVIKYIEAGYTNQTSITSNVAHLHCKFCDEIDTLFEGITPFMDIWNNGCTCKSFDIVQNANSRTDKKLQNPIRLNKVYPWYG